MTAVRVEDKLTQIAEPALVAAVAAGYRLTMGSSPSAECLAVLCAQVFLETGRGLKMHCWNPGNRKAPRDWNGLVCGYACDEIFDYQTAREAQRIGHVTSVTPWRGGPLFRVVLPADHPWSRFCAFENAAEGMADYVALLACSDRYRAAWTLAFRGDADGFARALGVAHYYTADPATYARGVVSIAASLLPLCRATLADTLHELDEDEVFNIAAAVSNTVSESLIWNHDRHEALAA